MLVGKRTGGKSFLAKEEWIKDFIATGRKKVLCRRKEEDFKKGKAKNYWRDVNEEGWVSKWTNGKYTVVVPYGSEVFLGNINEKGKPTREVQIGDYYALSTYINSKSVAFPSNYNGIYFEEFISDKGYIDDEPRTFMHFISTVSRGRDDFRVTMIGNSIDPDCVYFSEWSMPEVPELEQGVAKIYKFTEIDEQNEPYTVNIVVYSTDKKEGGAGHLMFGQSGKQVATGIWESKAFTHPQKGADYKIVYSLEIVGNMQTFIVNLVKDKQNKGLVVRVYPKKKKALTQLKRVIYVKELAEVDANPLHTGGFKKDIPAEVKIMELLKDPTKTGYATNLCGQSFKNMLKQSKLLGW